jgi:hypothetical protein
MNTQRDEAIQRIAAAASGPTGIGEDLIIGLLIKIIPQLFGCLDGGQTPEQWIAAHTKRDGSPRPAAVARLSRVIQREGIDGQDALNPTEAGIIARKMFAEGQQHGERVGALMKGDA